MDDRTPTSPKSPTSPTLAPSPIQHRRPPAPPSARSSAPSHISIPPRGPVAPALEGRNSPTTPFTDSGSSQGGDSRGGGPDLTNSAARMYPIRSVVYPSSKSKGRRESSSETPSSTGTMSQDVAANRNYFQGARPLMSPGGVGDGHRSLDPFLPEPTTHERIDQPQSSRPVITRAATRSANTSVTGQSDAPLMMATRFEHVVSEDGTNWVLTGREGRLERCEDEPIHAPGAVQGFGVLIAFDMLDDGSLYVQQVSENSGFILGIPPNVLFKQNSLSRFLSEEENEALLDAIDSLDERDLEEDNTDEGPLNFFLSGYGLPGTATTHAKTSDRLEWNCHAAVFRPDRVRQPRRVILELELVDDPINPIATTSDEAVSPEERGGVPGSDGWEPSRDDLAASTVSMAKPLRALARLRRRRATQGGVSSDLDIVSLLSQINEQLNKTQELESFLKVVASIFHELTGFDRAMVYQFDEAWNGRVVAEQVDWTKTKDLFRGLNFPASDIPAQARELYKRNKVRLLYDRDQPTARMCCRSLEEVENPLDLSHSLLRAMSPIHIKYLGNMGVRSSMSISITAFGDLWGLVSCHTYGRFGLRVSFPLRQLCKLLGESISRNIERLSYAKRLHARKLINTAATEANPSGYIVAKAEDLLHLFEADFGCLSIGEEAKILGPVDNSQELLAVLEYLRQQIFTTIQISQDIKGDFPEIDYPSGFKKIAGMLTVPLSSEGRDFIVFFRRGVLQTVNWAGRPYKDPAAADYSPLEPRKSFKTWSEVVVGKSQAWTDEQIETAGVLSLVYGKFIAVWREKETAMAANHLTKVLLQNAGHEVRTPLNAIINYLELALDGNLDGEVRDNLMRSHTASKSLIHVINDLLDLTRTERGKDLLLTDPFNLPETIQAAVVFHKEEAERRGLRLEIIESPTGTPSILIGDRARIRQLLTNVVANAVKNTQTGGIEVIWGEVADEGERQVLDGAENKKDSIRIGISISDTGAGISEAKLETIFREFESVSTAGDEELELEGGSAAVGLGLATVARIVRNLDGQLKVESKLGVGSKFTFTLPFLLPKGEDEPNPASQGGSGDLSVGTVGSRTVSAGSGPLIGRPSSNDGSIGSKGSMGSKGSSNKSEIDSLITAMSANHMDSQAPAGSQRSIGGSQLSRSPTSSTKSPSASSRGSNARSSRSTGQVTRKLTRTSSAQGSVPIQDSNVDLHAVKLQPPMGSSSPTIPRHASLITDDSTVPTTDVLPSTATTPLAPSTPSHMSEYKSPAKTSEDDLKIPGMRVLVVEDEMINRMILQKRLKMDAHEVVIAEHGGIALRILEEDPHFDVVLMDLQMPVVNGLEASKGIRDLEAASPLPHALRRPSSILNGRLPIIAVTASLTERQKGTIVDAGIDGWCLKPVDYKRLKSLLRGAIDATQRKEDIYSPGAWERGGWLAAGASSEELKNRARAASISSLS